jgi:hypothetical protein
MRKPWVRLPKAAFKASSQVSRDSSADNQGRDNQAVTRKSQLVRVAEFKVRDNATQVRARTKAASLAMKTFGRRVGALAREVAKNNLRTLAYQQKYGDVPMNAAVFFSACWLLLFGIDPAQIAVAA